MKVKVFLRISLILSVLFFSISPVLALGQIYRPAEIIDRPAPNFSLLDLEGRQIELSSYKGKNLILFFWTTWCYFCRGSLVKLQRQYPSIKAQGIEVLAIDIGESIYKVKNFLNRHPVSFSVLLDSQGNVAERFNIMGVPTYVLIDSKGDIRLIDNSLPRRVSEVFR